jgi:hypothetical protein
MHRNIAVLYAYIAPNQLDFVIPAIARTMWPRSILCVCEVLFEGQYLFVMIWYLFVKLHFSLLIKQDRFSSGKQRAAEVLRRKPQFFATHVSKALLADT